MSSEESAGRPSADRLRIVHSVPRGPKVRGPLVPNEVLGVTIFILSEMMFFAGLISAFTITKSAAAQWPPPGQPRLPLEETAINTVALLISGGLLWWAGRRFEQVGPRAARAPFLAALGLGAFFVAFQGYEWAGLLSDGLTLTSSSAGSFFYLIVGTHALHVIGGWTVLALLFRLLVREQLTTDGFWAARLFWYFVVGLWPLLYWRVYV
jgi:cytochrome c oxidase subunit 3